VLLVVLCAVTSVGWARNKPNIVVIMTGNQGYGDLGCYGGVLRQVMVNA
jgi:arylsulfatase A-like enzyme